MNATERLNGWAKVLALFLPLTVAGLIAWGSLKSDVRNQAQMSQSYANRETVQAQYAAILRELQLLNARMERLEAK